MITINGIKFHEPPCMCGGCPALIIGRNDAKGFCKLFEKRKNRWDSTPKHCKEMFVKAFAYGGHLALVSKT